MDDLYFQAQILEQTDKPELEARIKGPILHRSNVLRLLALYSDWDVVEYKEQRSRIIGTSAIYRSIDDGDIIMKTKVDRVKDEWFALVLSLEEKVDGMTLVSRYFSPSNKKRWSRWHRGMRLDVTYITEADMYQVEVEMTKIKKLERFLSYVRFVVDVLLDSPEFISRKRFELAKEIADGFGTTMQLSKQMYQKPTTLEWDDLLRVLNVKDLMVTPKMDGTRVFILVFNCMIYSVDTIGHVRLLAVDAVYSSPNYLIVDAEKVGDTYYAFDFVQPDGVPLSVRLEKLSLAVDVVKDYIPINIKKYTPLEKDNRVDEIQKYWQNLDKSNLDGIIFVDPSGNYMDNVWKWKPRITVDLCLRDGQLYSTRNKIVDELQLDHDYPMETTDAMTPWNNIYELELLGDGLAKIICSRNDKATPNSRNVILSNIRAHDMGNIWNPDSCYLMRRYHSQMRRYLLPKHLTDKIVLDISTGSGYMVQWEHATKVYCVRYDKKSRRDLRQKTTAVPIKVVKNGDNLHISANVISLFFSVNRLDVSEIISQNSASRCKIVGIFMDGERVPYQSVTTEVYTIIPHGNNEYQITINGIGLDCVEKRTTLMDLERIFGNMGFKLDRSFLLDNREIYMSTHERGLSSMFRSFVFVRK